MTLNKWVIGLVSLLILPLFGIVFWQLFSIDPIKACAVVKQLGVPPGDHCFKLFMRSFDIRGYALLGALATLATLVIIGMVYLAKTVISVVGPGNVSINIGSKGGDNGTDSH